MTSLSHTQNPDVRKVVLVSRYATPFAILLVLMAIVLASPVSVAVRNASILLLIFSIVFNVVAVELIRRLTDKLPWFKSARLWINLAVNVALVWLLGPFWPPMWLLLALTPIATAIYEGPTKTLLASSGTAALIVVIHLLRGGGGAPHEWGEVLSYAAFIVLMSLLINELTQASYPNHPQDRR